MSFDEKEATEKVFVAYLRCVLRNTALAYWRKRARHYNELCSDDELEAAPVSDHFFEDPGMSDINRLSDYVENDILSAAIRSLGRTEKVILYFWLFHSLTDKEIARIVGISPHSVFDRRHRILKKIRCSFGVI